MAPRETENNAYSNFWGDKQTALWYVMVFSGAVNCYSPTGRDPSPSQGYKYHDVEIDQSLSWTDHVDKIAEKSFWRDWSSETCKASYTL